MAYIIRKLTTISMTDTTARAIKKVSKMEQVEQGKVLWTD